MKIQNTSGRELYFELGSRGVKLANNAIGYVGDDIDTIVKAKEHQDKGLLKILAGPVPSDLLSPVDIPGHRLITLATAVAGNILSITAAGISRSFEFVASGGPVTGDAAVLLGANTAEAGVNLAAAINAYAPLRELGIKALGTTSNATTNSVIAVAATLPGTVAIADVTVAKTGAPITIGAVVALVENATKKSSFVTATVAAAETTVVTGLTSIESFVFQVRTAAGAIKAYDGNVVANGGLILFDDNGTADLAATDVINVFAVGV
jgi:hypothetical protein